jgi:hypothetical protein
MKKFLVGMLMMIGMAGLASAEDTVCINDPFCQGDKVVTYSTPSFFMIITTNGIQFGDGTTQTTAGGAGGGGAGAFFTFTDNSGNKAAISSMTFPASLFTRLVTGSSQTILVNPSSFTLYGPQIPTSGISAGTFGTSILVSSIVAQTINAANIKSTNDPADTQVPKYDAATGLVTWSADNNSGGGGGSSGDKLTSSSMTVVNGGTDGNAQNVASFQVNGSTKAYMDSLGNWQFGKFAASRPIVVSSNSWLGIGTNAPRAPLHVVQNPLDGNDNDTLAYFDGTSAGSYVPRVWFRPVNSSESQFNLDFNSASGHSAWKYNTSLTANPDQFWFSFLLNNTLILSMRDTGRVGINTLDPAGALHVSSAPGYAGIVLEVTTGTTKLFEVTGASVSVYGEMYLNGFKMSTGVVTPASSGVSDPIAIASGSIAHLTSSGSIKTLLIEATAYHTLGTGAGIFRTPSGELQIDVNADGTPEMKVNTSSVSVNGHDIMQSTFITPIAHYSFVSIATSTYEINYPTNVLQGLPLFEHTASSSIYSLHRISLPGLVSGAVPTLKRADAISRSASDSGTMVFGISIATIGAGGFDVNNLVFSSTRVVTLTGLAGAVNSIKSWVTEVPLPGFQTVSGAGNCDAIIRVTPMGGTSTAQRVFHGAAIAWKEQK